MYISCNELKKHIKDSEKIDWLDIWNKFTIRSAEIDGVEVKGNDINNVIVAEIIELSVHPTVEKYNVAKLDIGRDNPITLISSAKNLYVGMKAPCALPGGSLKGIPSVEKIEFEGVLSEGILASEKELGISDKHIGVMELDKNYKNGTNIKDIMPIDDIIIEIDNKSLTNRPDMWGQYGIAREVAAITGHELLPLSISNKLEGSGDIDIKILDTENCNRYSALKIENITEKESNVEMKIMLYYCGMRSISLLVDLSNYIMLELGQPMHTFDAKKINNIVVKNTGNERIKFTTLDGNERDIAENTLMICNGDLPVAIAGIMGGQNSEIDDNSTSVILESANFDATNIRKSAISIGLRTESSARYEKSLDPNMTILAIQRFVKLLSERNPEIKIASNIVDIYPNKIESAVVHLKKNYLKKYMGFDMQAELVINILSSLNFEVEEKENEYIVTAPTYRSTKDISNEADVIEEIARIYGYENMAPVPLKLDLTIQKNTGRYELEYNLKKDIVLSTNFHEVHTYLWYQNDMLETYGFNKDNNIKVINKSKNNILRDDITLSLFEQCLNNSKYYNEYGIFEIGSCIRGEGEDRILSLLKVCSDSNVEENYNNIKQLMFTILRKIKGHNIEFKIANIDRQYIDNNYSLEIFMNNQSIGFISVFDKKYTKDCGKKISIIVLEINTEVLLNITKEFKVYKEPSKYQTVFLDYTIIMKKDERFDDLKTLLDSYKNDLIVEYSLQDVYKDDNKKVTVRYIIGSNEKTLTTEDIQEFNNKFISFIEQKYNIVK
jgi:phenylalanyl-tRNA synthetase beta chain